MKKLILICTVFLICSANSRAEDVTWYTWDEGYKVAIEQNKPMLVFIHATWCHLCQRMDSKVFTDEEVASLIHKNFIAIKLDAEFSGTMSKDGSEYTTGQLLNEMTNNKFRGIPSLVFIPAKTNRKNTLEVGLKDPTEMMALLKKHK